MSYSEIEPISKHTFQQHVKVSFLYQLITIAVLFSILKVLNVQFADFSSFIFISIIFLGIIFSIRINFDFRIISGRFKDIYPDSEFNIYHYIATLFFPISFFLLIGFLYFKSPVKHIRKSLPFRDAIYAFIPVISLQLFHSNLAYYLASPSTYHVVKSFNETMSILSYKKTLKNSDHVFSNYRAKAKKIDSSGFVMVTNLSAWTIINDKSNISKINTNPVVAYHFGTKFVRELSEILIASENTQFEFSDYSILHWLHPAGVVEILLLSGVEKTIKNQLEKKILEKDMKILADIEIKINRLPAGTQEIYKLQLKKVRESVGRSKTMNILENERDENHFPVK